MRDHQLERESVLITLHPIVAVSTWPFFGCAAFPRPGPSRSSNFTLETECTVPQKQLFHTGLSSFSGQAVNSSLAGIRSLAARVIVSGSYPTPSSPCGVCRYYTEVIAPAVNCSNITSSYNFASPFPPPQSSVNVYWNGTYSFDDSGLNLQVAWRTGYTNDQSFSPPNAINCTAYNATYYVNMTHANSVSTMDVTHIEYHEPVLFPGDGSWEARGMVAIVDALAVNLRGIVAATNATLEAQDNLIAYSIIQLNSNVWGWSIDPTVAIPWLMQNVSLSMLAGNVGTDPRNPSVTTSNRACYQSALVFHYDPVGLLVTYGSGALVVLVCAIAGFWSVSKNGVDESLSFSRWVDALVHQDMLDGIRLR